MKGLGMGTLKYCDADDCKNCDHSYDGGIYDVPSEVAVKLDLNKYDSHLCKECIDNSCDWFGISLGILKDEIVLN